MAIREDFRCEVCGAPPKFLVEDVTRRPHCVASQSVGWQTQIDSVHLFCDQHNRPPVANYATPPEARKEPSPANAGAGATELTIQIEDRPPTPVGNALYLAVAEIEMMVGRLRVLMSDTNEPFESADNVRALLLLNAFGARFGDFLENYGSF
jgi:hypothetical protein